MDRTDAGASTEVSGKPEDSLNNSAEKTHKLSESKSRFIKLGILLTIVLSAWLGAWICGMDRTWAVVISSIGGFLSMVVGMVLAGIKYQDDIIQLAKKHVEELAVLKGRVVEMEEEMSTNRRDFGMSALMMVKTVADKVSTRMIARHASNLHVEEQRDAAIKEADAIVAEEILSYGKEAKSE